MDQNFEFEQEVIVEPLPNSITASSLMTDRMLAKASPQATPVFVSNPSSMPVILKKGTVIASISALPKQDTVIIKLISGEGAKCEQ